VLVEKVVRKWNSLEELENSPAFQGLMIAAAGKPERSMGDALIPAEPPQWKEVHGSALEFLDDSPIHVSVLITFIKAEANLNGYPGLASAFTLADEILHEQWDALFPLADTDDLEDPYYGRVNALRELSDEPVFIDTIYRMPLVDVRGIGAYSTRDIDIAAGTLNASEKEQSRCQNGLIHGAFQESDLESLQAISRSIEDINKACTAIESLFAEKGGKDQALSFSRLTTLLGECRTRFLEYAEDRLIPIAVIGETADSKSQSIHSVDSNEESELRSHLPEQPLQIRSRFAVTDTFTQIINYYQKNEPASPVVVFAHRAREMVTKPFFGLIQDLAPSHKDSFSASLEVLRSNPLMHLMEESYRKFLAGEELSESVPVSSQAAPVQPVVHQDTSEVSSPESQITIRDIGSTEEFSGLAESKDPVDTSRAADCLIVETRDQVLNALTELDMFFRVNEPASPIPLVISEMRKLVPKTFVELVTEFNRSLSDKESLSTGKTGDHVTET